MTILAQVRVILRVTVKFHYFLPFSLCVSRKHAYDSKNQPQFFPRLYLQCCARCPIIQFINFQKRKKRLKKNNLELSGIEPKASRMRNERSTTELQPLTYTYLCKA